jgi:hypothetical protein
VISPSPSAALRALNSIIANANKKPRLRAINPSLRFIGPFVGPVALARWVRLVGKAIFALYAIWRCPLSMS